MRAAMHAAGGEEPTEEEMARECASALRLTSTGEGEGEDEGEGEGEAGGAAPTPTEAPLETAVTASQLDSP